MAAKSRKDISDRQNRILKIVVYSYVNSAMPVGSRLVSELMGLSSATIRNIMSDLEEMGYITHPHTSAGGIPTDKGYRCYVESLMRFKNITKEEARRIREEYSLKRKSIEDFIKKTAGILSKITHQTGLIFFPRLKKSTFEHIDLIPMGKEKALVVLVTSAGVVRHFIIDTEEDIAGDLNVIANLLNSECCGLSLEDIKERLIKKAREERDSFYFILGKASRIVESALKVSYENELYFDGASCLLAQPEFGDSKSAKSILQIFEDRDIFLKLIEGDLQKEGISIHIGKENRCPSIQKCSIVTSGYRMKDGLIGRLGIIGPTRMAYDHLIPVVNYVSEIVSERLNELVE